MPTTIYVPIYILSRHTSRYLGGNFFDDMPPDELRANLNQSARLGYPPSLTYAELNSPERNAIIAERINHYMEYCANCNPYRPPIFQVGIDAEEAFRIVNQHSWYKRFAGYGAAKIIIPDNRFRPRLSEIDYYGPNILNAREGNFHSLQPGTRIGVEVVGNWQIGHSPSPFHINNNLQVRQQPAPQQNPNVSRGFGFFLRMLLGQNENVGNAPAPAAPVAAPAARASEPAAGVSINVNVNEQLVSDIAMPGNMPIIAQARQFEGILDPILFTPIDDPVTTPDGYSFSRGSILQWLQRSTRGDPKDPITKNILYPQMLRGNLTLKSLIAKNFDPTAPVRVFPNEFIDQFNNKLIEDAVLAEDGYVYDRKSLLAECQKNGSVTVLSPKDGKTQIGRDLIIDRTLMSLLDEYHGSRDDKIEELLHRFPKDMSEEQLIGHIRHYSMLITLESGSRSSPVQKPRNFYLAERLLCILDARYDETIRSSANQQSFDHETYAKAQEGKIITQIMKDLLNHHNSFYQGKNKVNRINYAARIFLTLERTLADLTFLPRIYRTQEIDNLIVSLLKISREVLDELEKKKPFTGNNPLERNPDQHYPEELDLVDISSVRQKVTQLEQLFSVKELTAVARLETICKANRSKTLVMFDYDGTLVTLGTPKRPITDKAELKRILSILAANPNVIVAIASIQGQERKSPTTKAGVDYSIEEFLEKELGMDRALVAKIQIYGMDSYNTYVKEQAGKSQTEAKATPFKVAMAKTIYQKNNDIGKFVFVNDSTAELNEMQKEFKDLVPVPILLDAAKNNLINKECFSYLTTICNYDGLVNDLVVEQHIQLKKAWFAGYTTELGVSMEMKDGPEKDMYCIGSGYFNMTIEALRAYIEYENKLNNKSASSIMFATKIMFELAQVNSRELNATAINGYLNLQLAQLHSPQYPEGYRLANWLLVLIKKIKSCTYEREVAADLAQIREAAEREAQILLQKRKDLASLLVADLNRLFPGFTCQHKNRLELYKKDANYLSHPENVFKGVSLSEEDGTSWVANSFLSYAKYIVAITGSKTNENRATEINISAVFAGVFANIYEKWLEKRSKLEESQNGSWWGIGKQSNPIWVKPPPSNSGFDKWINSIVDYVKQLNGLNIAKDHPAIILMKVCQQLFVLPMTTIDSANINLFISEIQNHLQSTQLSSAAAAISPRKK